MRNTMSRSPKGMVEEIVRRMGALPAWLRRSAHYTLALLFVAAAATLRWALPDALGPTPFLAFYLAWVGAAVFGGAGPGLLATVASWLCIDVLFDPTGELSNFRDPTTIVRLVVLLAGGLTVSLVASKMRRGRFRERQSEARLRTVVENLTEGLIAADLDGRLVQWNRTALDMHGFASLEEAQRRLPEFADIFELSTLDGKVVPLEQWPLARVLRGEDLRDVEVRVRRIVGGWERVFSYAGSLVRDDRGQSLLAVLTVTDITERKRAEVELRQSESFYRQTLESIPGMVFTTLPDGYCDYQSQQWVDYTGVPMSEHLGSGWNKLLHPEDRLRALAAWRDAVEGKAPYDLEYRVRRHDGRYEWFKVIGRPIRDEAQRIVRWFGVAMNIEAMKRTEQALRESEQRHRLIVENVQDYAIFMLDPKGNVVSWNVGAERIIGYKAEEIIGRNFSMLYLPEAIERGKPQSELDAAVRNGRGEDEGWRVRKDGSRFWASTVATALCDEAGNLKGFSKITRDLTERKQAEEVLHEINKRLQEQADELAAINKDLEQFAYIASHDLQEPLRAVSGFVTLLHQRYAGRLDEKADSYIGSAVEGASRMQALINGLLEYSRVGSRGNVPAPASANDALKEALASLQTLIQESGAVVTSDPLPRVQADATQLAHVFQNLIANAIKFRSEKTPEIHVGSRRQDGSWLFWVRDNGIGIDPKYNERIFMIFQRLHTRSKYPGTGIGLAICKRIVERHGGSIWVESQPDRGSTFYFTLPDKGETHESS